MQEYNRACTLRSGSSGNSIFLQNEDTSILIDAGVSARTLIKAMHSRGIRPEALHGILVTHEHSDHVAGLAALAKAYDLAIYLSEGTWEAFSKSKKHFEALDTDKVHLIKANRVFELGSLAIKPFRIPHDASDPLGFRIDTGKSVLAVASDIGEWTTNIEENVSAADLVFLEANYDNEMLWKGPYPWPLKKRIVSPRGHLSNIDSALAAYDLLESGVSRFVLIHLSKQNNTPELAFHSVESYLREQGANLGRDYLMTTSPRYDLGLWQYW